MVDFHTATMVQAWIRRAITRRERIDNRGCIIECSLAVITDEAIATNTDALNDRDMQSLDLDLSSELTLVVAVFVTKQVPPFSQGLVRQKTNCE